MTIKACMAATTQNQTPASMTMTMSCAVQMLTESGIKEYELTQTILDSLNSMTAKNVAFYMLSSIATSKYEAVTCCPLWHTNDGSDPSLQLGIRLTRITESGSRQHVDVLGGHSYFTERPLTQGLLVTFGISRVKGDSPDSGYFVVPAVQYALQRKIVDGWPETNRTPLIDSFVFFTSNDGLNWSRRMVALPDYFKTQSFIDAYENSGGPLSGRGMLTNIQGNSNVLAFLYDENLFYSRDNGSSWVTTPFPKGFLRWYKKPTGERLLCGVTAQAGSGAGIPNLVGIPLFDWNGNFLLNESEPELPPYPDIKWTPAMPRLDILYHPSAMATLLFT